MREFAKAVQYHNDSPTLQCHKFFSPSFLRTLHLFLIIPAKQFFAFSFFCPIRGKFFWHKSIPTLLSRNTISAQKSVLKGTG